jgi:hypothetical protein
MVRHHVQRLTFEWALLIFTLSVPNFVFASHLQPRDSLICANICQGVGSALQTCPGDQCYCPTVVAQGPACISCISPFDTTFANMLGPAITGCISRFPPLATNPTSTAIASSICLPECAPIIAAVTSCADLSCFCGAMLKFGSTCNACWATIDTVEAGNIATQLSECHIAATGGTISFPSTTRASPSTGAGFSIPASSTSTSVSRSGAKKECQVSVVHYIFLTVFLSYLCSVILL